MMKSLQNSPMDFDELDLMLIRELEQNARVSSLSLASKLGTSQQTVSRRFNRLVDQGIITIATIPNYVAMGYGTVLVLALNVAPGTVNVVAEQLATISEIKSLWITTGRYDILAVAVYRNPEECLSSFQEEFGNIPTNVRMETMLAVRMIKSSWSYLTHDDIAVMASPPRAELTELDFSVIKELEKSPRIPTKELAHTVGASLPVVRASLRKLTSHGVIRVISVPTAEAFGYIVRGITLIQVHPSSLKTLTDKLKAYSCIQKMALTFGAFNCILWTSFQNSDQMTDFLIRVLGNMPGIMHYESLSSLKVQKREFNLLS